MSTPVDLQGNATAYKPPKPEEQTKITTEHTGGSSSYYDIEVNALLLDGYKRTKVVKVRISCNDVIQALKMNFAQGNIFKAVWRICASKLGRKKRGNNTTYDAEKIVFFGNDLIKQEYNK